MQSHLKLDYTTLAGCSPDLAAHAGTLLAYVEAIRAAPGFSAEVYNRLVRELARAGHPILPKAPLRRACAKGAGNKDACPISHKLAGEHHQVQVGA